MGKFSQLARKVFSLNGEREENGNVIFIDYNKIYRPEEYEYVKDRPGTQLATMILAYVNDAVRNQRQLLEDVNLLAEKVIAKIDFKRLIEDNGISWQTLYDQYRYILYMNGMWTMLMEKFVDYEVVITERQFRDVAGIIMFGLKDLSKKEEDLVEDVANNCIRTRQDGRLEIVFPGKLWGGAKVPEILKKAEEKGICIVETNASPIRQKCIFPLGWTISDYTDWEGYRLIFDEKGQQQAVFRVTELPNHRDNGAVDFFMMADNPWLNSGGTFLPEVTTA